MNSVEVQVKAQYLSEQSKPQNNQYVYAYTINIINHGENSAQLLSRHWRITDEQERVQEVLGEGVIGKQPTILPGESYTYSSGVVLETQSGTMTGAYTMLSESGEQFKAEIPTFALVQPKALH